MEALNYKIAIIEDIESIRRAIFEYLKTEFIMSSYPTAEDFLEAIERDEDAIPHLLISDIKMPGMGGLELIHLMQKEYPDVHTALMTSYDIDQYINFCKQKRLTHIIPKTLELNLEEIAILARKLLSRDIFGPEKYFPRLKIVPVSQRIDDFSPASGELIYKRIRSSKERNLVCNGIGKFLKQFGDHSGLSMVLDELTSNALYKAPHTESGHYKYQTIDKNKSIYVPLDNIELEEKDYFNVGFGYIDDTIILSTLDSNGSLTKEEILYRLDRHISKDSNGLPLGLQDTHGRGLFIMREKASRLIFNLEKQKRTEVICFFSSKATVQWKGVYIYEK